jgi:hypothetical protein
VDSFCQEFNAKMMFAGATKQGKIKLLSNGNVPATHTKV